MAFIGPILKNALAFGDVDGDGESELVIGNENGELAIFKDSFHHSSKPWFQTTGLRMISAIAIGSFIEPHKNTIVVVSGDGWCHILLPGPAPSCPPDVPLGCDNNMHVAHIQCIPPNTHVSIRLTFCFIHNNYKLFYDL
jgi:Integrin-alpha FG-GAP repeat-containing protein 2/FG-GAP repeat